MTVIPTPDTHAAWRAAQALQRHGHPLAALEALQRQLGDVFTLPLPGFHSVILVGPEANRFLLVDARERLRWRSEHDPVTQLLRQGVLVTDGARHDELRQAMSPTLHRTMFDGYLPLMWQSVDHVTAQWSAGARIDLLTETRRIALLILTSTLFSDDFAPRQDDLWPAILRTLRYIAPGPWLLWPAIPRVGYRRALHQVDAYLLRLIAARRAQLEIADDLLGRLIAAGMNDALIRDQLLTMFIAGHDTSTALLAWSLYLLCAHPAALAQVRLELDTVLGGGAPTYERIAQLTTLDHVIKETLRLYPPIHLGSRIAANDLVFHDYAIPSGTRVLYSPYLTHRDPRYWPDPERFDPDRFAPQSTHSRPAFAFVPFGGGPRNCMGAAFAVTEAKVVLARLLQRCDFQLVGGRVRPRMGATLEPSPGVLVEVQRRSDLPAPQTDTPGQSVVC
jgi:cytochrome P450